MRWKAASGVVGLWAWGVALAGPVVREELQVQVGAVTERWRLEWRSAPTLACFEGLVTCPCEGFAQAEQGELDLVRLRPGEVPTRLPLSPLFGEPPSGQTRPQAMLRGWMPSPKDEELPQEQWKQALRRRPRTRAMVLGDYDHDGQAREFVLQIAAEGCGLRAAVLVGIDRREGRLRALGTAEHPERPLVLEPETWDRLRGAARIEAVQTPCGDHGSDLEEVLRVHADDQGLHATRVLYQCTDAFKRAALDSSEVL